MEKSIKRCVFELNFMYIEVGQKGEVDGTASMDTNSQIGHASNAFFLTSPKIYKRNVAKSKYCIIFISTDTI